MTSCQGSEAVLIGQSGGPTAAINASLAGAVEAARAAGAPVLGMRHGIQGALAGDLVDLDQALPSPLELRLLRQTPASWLGSCRYKLPDPGEDERPYQGLLGLLSRRHVGVVAYAGGNDSMDTTAKLAAYAAREGSGVRFVGIPKTIDNDLPGTDHTPGFGSAARFVATAVSELTLDADVYDLKNVLVVEIMGRDAGWLAASACLADAAGGRAPDVVLLPEAPVDDEALVAKVASLLERQNTVVVAASEGATRPDGTSLAEAPTGGAAVDAFGHAAALSGTGRAIARLLGERLGVKTRAVELSTFQRAASHCAAGRDLDEAAAQGGHAVAAGLAGQTGVMACLERLSDAPYQARVGLVDVSQVANGVRHVPGEWVTPDGMGVTGDFHRYAAPLIEGDVELLRVGGVPAHLRAL